VCEWDEGGGGMEGVGPKGKNTLVRRWWEDGREEEKEGVLKRKEKRKKKKCNPGEDGLSR